MKIKLLVVVVCLLVFGCASTTPTTIPSGCEQSVVYTRLPGFMPNGPMITRVSVSTALSIAATAGHPEVKGIVALTMPILYKATLQNSLAGAMVEVKAKFNTGKVGEYITPLLVLFDSLNQAGVIQGGQVGLTDCDKNVIASLFKNIGLDSGTDPSLFL